MLRSSRMANTNEQDGLRLEMASGRNKVALYDRIM
jgi:hypothetical protein